MSKSFYEQPKKYGYMELSEEQRYNFRHNLLLTEKKLLDLSVEGKATKAQMKLAAEIANVLGGIRLRLSEEQLCDFRHNLLLAEKKLLDLSVEGKATKAQMKLAAEIANVLGGGLSI